MVVKMQYIEREFQPPEDSFFLFGPRGTGKSTWLKAHYPEAVRIDLLEADTFRNYSAAPERLRNLILTHPHCLTIIIDEVQKVPELLSEIHALIEKKRGIQFILTGSSSRKLKRAGVDLLAGRAVMRHFFPFSPSELGEKFSLEKALQTGTLPLVWDAKNPQEKLKTYVSLYLKEEVQEEGLVRKIGDFARFLEIISFSHGAILNTSNIARECQVNRSTVENYLQILKDLMLGFTLENFTRRAQRELSSHPKFYLFDPGVFLALRPRGHLDSDQEY